MFRCPQLVHLELQDNNFSGYILNQIENLTDIQVLDISDNRFTGSIPIGIGNSSEIVSLGLSQNNLEGPIPFSICKLTSLSFLHISNNELDGSIPQCIGNFSDGLQLLLLKENHLSGVIPATFQVGCTLDYLSLNGNQLEGTLPRSLSNCTSLRVLDVGKNDILDFFPTWLDGLPELRVLILQSNKLHGQILPSSSMNSHFPKLQVFDISHNEFTGVLPIEYINNFTAMTSEMIEQRSDWYLDRNEPVKVVIKGSEQDLVNLLVAFTMLDLSDNHFSGGIPYFIGNLRSLVYLNFSHNNLIGSIPKSLGNMVSLEALDLSSNNFVGEIPRGLSSLKFLSVLNLSSNHLVGPLPPYVDQFATFTNKSYIGNLGLYGCPLTKNCSDGHKVEKPGLPLPQEKVDFDSNFIDGLLTWHVVVMGYGFGFIIGISLGYLMFSYRRPRVFMKLFL